MDPSYDPPCFTTAAESGGTIFGNVMFFALDTAKTHHYQGWLYSNQLNPYCHGSYPQHTVCPWMSAEKIIEWSMACSPLVAAVGPILAPR